MRKNILMLSTFTLTVVYPPFAWTQSFASTWVPKSSPINLKGLTKKANSGSIVAKFELGFAYQFGKGVDKDIYEAIRWYRLAADNGGPSAQNNLG